MLYKPITKSFFEEKTLKVARNLVGKILVRKIGDKVVREIITEVEAYVGPHDLACHSARGRTARTEVMFKEAGTIYVYLIYGMHYMLNIVTEERDFPAAVLIRGTDHFKSPGVLTRELKIDKSLNGKSLGQASGLWIEENPDYKLLAQSYKLSRTPRIGVAYSGAWAAKPYRFILQK